MGREIIVCGILLAYQVKPRCAAGRCATGNYDAGTAFSTAHSTNDNVG